MPTNKKKICSSCGKVHQGKLDKCFACAKKELIDAFRAEGNGNCVMCGCQIPDSRLFISQYCHHCSFESKRQSVNATNKLKSAIKSGLVKPIGKDTKCVDCGNPATHFDHRDYNKPLDVEPVCRGCNKRRGPALHVKEPA